MRVCSKAKCWLERQIIDGNEQLLLRKRQAKSNRQLRTLRKLKQLLLAIQLVLSAASLKVEQSSALMLVFNSGSDCSDGVTLPAQSPRQLSSSQIAAHASKSPVFRALCRKRRHALALDNRDARHSLPSRRKLDESLARLTLRFGALAGLFDEELGFQFFKVFAFFEQDRCAGAGGSCMDPAACQGLGGKARFC